MFSKALYNLFIVLYKAGIRLVSLWNGKARKWRQGRMNIFDNIQAQMAGKKGQPVWMHCASLGEFEQGRPLLEQLKKNHPTQQIVLSFFSPSGYEVMKDYTGADYIFYLPMDSAENAKRFLEAINPRLVLWVKYEYWYYYLTAIKERNIPTVLVSGIFRPSQPFFKWYGEIWRTMLGSFTHFFVQNAESQDLLKQLGFTQNVTINGDTRFDRVLEIAQKFEDVPFIKNFCGDSQVLVAGSTWEEDEIELLHFVNVNKHVKFIIAPHEINKVNLHDVRDEFPNSIFYSDLGKIYEPAKVTSADQSEPEIKPSQLPNVLIIDNIGMLSRLYKYATVTYIGGGFGADGVHNVLEAAVYAKPVVFGPVYEKFDEAIGLLEAGGAISIDGPVSLEAALNGLLQNEDKRKAAGEAAGKFVREHAGASNKILHYIQEKRLLTS